MDRYPKDTGDGIFAGWYKWKTSEANKVFTYFLLPTDVEIDLVR